MLRKWIKAKAMIIIKNFYDIENGFGVGSLPFLMFPNENKICFWQDFGKFEGVPSDRVFYPKDESNGSIVFIADRHGILKNNKWGLAGDYGNGAIYVSVEDLPSGVVKWCRENMLPLHL